MDERIAESDGTEAVGSEGLLSLVLLEGLAPVGRGQLENAANGPVWQKAEKVAQVAQGLDVVKLAAGSWQLASRVTKVSIRPADRARPPNRQTRYSWA